ncbi:MAG: MerR family transcriptional regulator [Ignavibacteriaceae bacterium]
MEQNGNYEQPLYAISVAAKILGVSVHTLRMYEREGLIVPYKKESSHRLYSQSDIDRLNCIRKAINELKISINGIKTIYSLIPCWNILKCSEHDRANCLAFHNHSEPCWTFRHINNVCTGVECRECAVYKNYTECGSIKECINNIQYVKQL